MPQYSELINITLKMMDKSSPYYKLVICFYLEQSVIALQSKFRQTRVLNGKFRETWDKHKKSPAIARKIRATYLKSMRHEFQYLKESDNEDAKEAFKADIVSKIKANEYHKINFKHDDFTRYLCAAARLEKNISLNELSTAKLLYEALLFCNQDQMPADPEQSMKRFLLSDVNGPYQPSAIGYWTEAESQQLAIELQKEGEKNHYYTINLSAHQTTLFLYYSVRVLNDNPASINPWLKGILKDYVYSKSSPQKAALLDSLDQIKPEPKLTLHHYAERMFFNTTPTTRVLEDNERSLKNKIIDFIKENEPNLALFFKSGFEDPHVADALHMSTDAFKKEVENINLFSSFFEVGSQNTGVCRSPDYNASDPNTSILAIMIPTRDTLDTIQRIAHKREMMPAHPLVGMISTRAIRAIDEIPAVIRSRPESPHFTNSQEILTTLYPLSRSLSMPHRASEFPHPDATRAPDIHGIKGYSRFMVLWHDNDFHAWRCGENHKDVIRFLRELWDDKAGFERKSWDNKATSKPNMRTMSPVIWALTDMDFSFGRYARLITNQEDAVKARLLSIMALFKKVGCNFHKDLDANYIILYSMVTAPNKWIPLLEGHSPLDIYSKENSTLNFVSNYSLAPEIERVHCYMHEHPKATIIDVILDGLLNTLNHAPCYAERVFSPLPDDYITETREKMKKDGIDHVYVSVIGETNEIDDLLDLSQDTIKSIYADVEKDMLQDYDAQTRRHWELHALSASEKVILNKMLHQSLQTKLERIDLRTVFYWLETTNKTNSAQTEFTTDIYFKKEHITGKLKPRLRDNKIEDICEALDRITEAAPEEPVHPCKADVYASAKQLGMSENAIKHLIKPACLDAIKEGLFTTKDLVSMESRTIRELIKPASLQAIRDKLFSLQDIANAPYDYFVELMRPRYYHLLRDRVFLLSDIKKMDRQLFMEMISSQESIKAMKAHLFTPRDVAEMNYYLFIYMLNSIDAIKGGLFTLKDIAKMDPTVFHYVSHHLEPLKNSVYKITDVAAVNDREIVQLINQEKCLLAIQEGRVTIDVLTNMDKKTLKQTIESDSYPGSSYTIH